MIVIQKIPYHVEKSFIEDIEYLKSRAVVDIATWVTEYSNIFSWENRQYRDLFIVHCGFNG